jgi:hypothetical protein
MHCILQGQHQQQAALLMLVPMLLLSSFRSCSWQHNVPCRLARGAAATAAAVLVVVCVGH